MLLTVSLYSGVILEEVEVEVVVFSLPSLSRRRSSHRSRKPTANRSHCDHGNGTVRPVSLLAFMGNVVFEASQTAEPNGGKTTIMAMYCRTAVTGVVVFCGLDIGERYNGTLGKKTFSRLSSVRKENQTVNIKPTKVEWEGHLIKIQEHYECIQFMQCHSLCISFLRL